MQGDATDAEECGVARIDLRREFDGQRIGSGGGGEILSMREVLAAENYIADRIASDAVADLEYLADILVTAGNGEVTTLVAAHHHIAFGAIGHSGE